MIPTWIVPDALAWYEMDGVRYAATVVCGPYQLGSKWPVQDGELGVLLKLVTEESVPVVRLHVPEMSPSEVVLGLHPMELPFYDPDTGEMDYRTVSGLDRLSPRDAIHMRHGTGQAPGHVCSMVDNRCVDCGANQ